MIEIVLTGISSLLVIDIVSFVINKLKANKAKNKKSTDEFEVRLDSIGPIIFIISSLFFGFCAFGASQATIENGYYTWPGFALVALLSAIAVFKTFTNIKVKGNNITYKSYLLPKIVHTTFSDIKYYSVYGNKTTLYNKDNKKLFSLDKDLIGYENLINRLNQENIICSDDGTNIRTIKKTDIIFRNCYILGLGILFLAISIIMSTVVITENISKGSLITGILDSMSFTAIMMGILLIVAVFIIVPAYINIKKIEKGLGINFDEEMNKEGITTFFFSNDTWYLDDYSFIVNRKYIKQIKKVETREGNKEYSQPDSKNFYFETIDGKTIKLNTTRDYKFRKWYDNKK